jgi:hypothetical protein
VPKLNIPVPAIGAYAHVMAPNTLDADGILVPHERIVVTPVEIDPEATVPAIWTCSGDDGYACNAPIQDVYAPAVEVALRVMELPSGLDQTELRDALAFASNYFPESMRSGTAASFFNGVTLLRVVATTLQVMVQFRIAGQSIVDPVHLQTQEQALRRLATAVDFQACKGTF